LKPRMLQLSSADLQTGETKGDTSIWILHPCRVCYVGRQDEARVQYRIASALDLSVADKAELARDVRG